MIGAGDAIADVHRPGHRGGDRGRATRPRPAARPAASRTIPTRPRSTRADSTYYAEVMRREEYDVDAQEVRSYFDFARVRQGLLDVTGRLFGLTYRAVEDAPRWHDEVTAYDVELTDDDGAAARTHLPRPASARRASSSTRRSS